MTTRTAKIRPTSDFGGEARKAYAARVPVEHRAVLSKLVVEGLYTPASLSEIRCAADLCGLGLAQWVYDRVRVTADGREVATWIHAA